jgi:RNA polymerase sigma-70 factor (ECF subfamily)
MWRELPKANRAGPPALPDGRGRREVDSGNETPGSVVVSGMEAKLERIGMAEGVARIAVDDPEEAFRQLSARHIQTAYRLAWAILGDDCDAEDATQDAFTSAWRQRSTLREADRFDAWFGRILVNSCRDRLRKRVRNRSLNLRSVGPEDEQPDHAPSMLERDELYRAVAELDPDQRIVVMLRFWMDLTVDDIADRLDVPAGTVKSRLHRSMTRLRAALEAIQ